jgi:hypothetical protein
MKTKEDHLIEAVGICLFLLLAAAAAWWFFARRWSTLTVSSGLPRSGWQSTSYFSNIRLPSGSTPATVEAAARASGFVVITNSFNDLIPAEDRSTQFDGATVFRYSTTNSLDEGLLAVPAAGTNCYLYFRASGDAGDVQKSDREVQELIRKLGKF